MALTKKIRFEVFKRDSFTCQYCGKSAPDVVLNVDHIQPRAKGGEDGILNLITACYDCNQGKKDRALSDDSVLQKRKAQLHLLQERREQLDMMMQWQRSITNIEDVALEQLAAYWSDLCPTYHLNASGLATLRRHLKKFSIPELAEAMRIAVTQYGVPRSADDPTLTPESIEAAFQKTPGIAMVQRRSIEKPYLADLYYIRGILRKRLSYCDDVLVMQMMEAAVQNGADVTEIRDLARRCSSWTNFRNHIVELEREM